MANSRRFDFSDLGPQSQKKSTKLDFSDLGPKKEITPNEEQQTENKQLPERKRNLLEMLSENPFNPLAMIKSLPKQAVLGAEMGMGLLDKLMSLPKEIEKSSALLSRDPLKGFKAFSAGAPDLAYGIINSPAVMLEQMQKVGLAPKELTELTNKYARTPDMSQAISQSLGLTGEEGEKGLRSIIPTAANITGALPLVKALPKLKVPASLKKVDYEKPIQQIQNKHDLRKSLNEKSFSDIQEEAYKRGTNKINNVSDYVQKIEKKNYLPDTPEYEALLRKAKNGDYKALRQLQADLGRLGIDAKTHKLSVDRNRGIEMLSLREKINDAIYNHFKKEGHLDLAEQLKNARKEYKNILETYHPSGKKATTATRAISKMVGENKVIPKNPETIFTEKSKPMDKFIKEHPEIAEVLKTSRNKEAQINLLKKFAVPGSVAGTMTGFEVIKYLLTGHL